MLWESVVIIKKIFLYLVIVERMIVLKQFFSTEVSKLQCKEESSFRKRI